MKILTMWSGLFFVISLSACQSIPKNFKATPSVAMEHTENTYWGRYFANEIKLHKSKSGLYPLQSGLDALIARLESIRKAEKSLDVQYYIWQEDSIGKMMWDELLQAADRGVRVRLLLDDLNIGGQQELLLVLDSHPQIEVRMFNPFAYRSWRFLEIFRFSEINRRMHNKSLIVDNQAVIIGGRNIGKEYFTASQEENFGDYDVWCFGPVVSESSRSFDLYWNDRLAVPITVLNKRSVGENDLADRRKDLAAASKEVNESRYAKDLENSELNQELKNGTIKAFWGRAKVFSDSPSKIRNDESKKHPPMLNQMTALPIKSEKEVFVVSPYFIPGKKGIEYFKRKNKQGVRVSVLTNSLESSDAGLVFAGYKKYRKDLIKSGVELYEMKPAIRSKVKTAMVASSGARLGLHGKVHIFDRRLMFVGSMNLDPRSVDLNSELGVLFESPELAEKFVTTTLKELPDIAYKISLTKNDRLQWTTREDNKMIVHDSEPEASGWKSFKYGFLSLFIPESLL